MATTTLNTRIKNKVDSYENWTSANPTLLAGEIAIVTIPGSTGAVQQEPATLFKVGDGVTAFKDLPFASGLAANVYSWALAAKKPAYTANEIQGLEDYISEKIQDTITIPKDILTEGSANGTVAFNGEDVAVHGLGTAAYQADTYFATAEALNTANEELAKKANASEVYNKGEVDNKISNAVSSVYKPSGSKAFEELPELSEAALGNVYNVTDEFTTDARFVEGAGQKFPAGTNVVVVKVAEEYKFDALAGFIDLSNHATKEELSAGIQESKTYADGLKTTMDARIQAVETEKHSHGNKALLDSYTQTEESLADAVAKKHDHANKEILDKIDPGKVAAWDAKADDSALAAIAKSGNAKDLTQTPGEYIIFDCGTATTTI